MDTTGDGSKRIPKAAKAVAWTLAVLCLGMAGLYGILALASRSPGVAARLSRYASAQLDHQVTIGGVRFTGGSIRLHDVTLQNHPAFGGGKLATSRSVILTPDWRYLLRGERRIALLAVDHLHITIDKDRTGTWNFQRLAGVLSRGGGGAELSVRQLRLRHVTLRVQGVSLENLDLDVHDLSTRGTERGRIVVAGTDGGGNPFRLEGSGNLGAPAGGELVVSARNLSPMRLLGRRRIKHVDLGQAAVTLQARVVAARDVVTVAGTADVRGLGVSLGGTTVPVTIGVAAAGRYLRGADAAFVDSCTIEVGGRARLHLRAAVREVRSRRAFTATLRADPAEIAPLYRLLPPELRRELEVRGRVQRAQVEIAGDAAGGVTIGTGTLVVAGGAVMQAGMAVARDLSLTAQLHRTGEGWQVRGNATTGTGDALLQRLHSPFAVTFSPRFAPVRAAAAPLAAEVLGVPVSGSVIYRRGVKPLRVRLATAAVSLADLRHPWWRRLGVTAGRGRLALEATGEPAQFTGTASLAVTGLEATVAGKAMAAATGRIEGTFARSGGSTSVRGEAACLGARLAGREGTFSFAYRLDGDTLRLTDLQAALGEGHVAIAAVQGNLPLARRKDGVTRTPVRLRVEGLSARRGPLAIQGMAGRVDAEFVVAGAKRWLQGDGQLAADLLLGGTEPGPVRARLQFDRGGMAANLAGSVAGGELAGAARVDPFASSPEPAFTLVLSGLHAERLPPLAKGTASYRATGGVLAARLSGEYRGGSGLRGQLEVTGDRLEVTGKQGRKLLTAGALRAVGDLGDDLLRVTEFTATVGAGAVLRGSGTVAHPLAASRSGHLSFAMPPTALEGVLTTFINVLPRALQEGTASGSIGAVGDVVIAPGRVVLQGRLSLAGAGLEIPSQRLTISGITGTVPVSLDTAATVRYPKRPELHRETFASRFASLAMPAAAAERCTIERIRFGAVELGKTSLALRAGAGLTEVVALRSHLFRGTLAGEGYFSYGRNMGYGGNLMVGDLSLTALCNAYPPLKGYLSGKVDGFLSLSGSDTGMTGVNGFVHVWAHGGRDERMQVSREFLQKLAGKKLKGIFFSTDRPYDRGEIKGYLEQGYLTFHTLDISNTNMFGIRDLSVTVAPVQNRIALEHLIAAIGEAATRGTTAGPEAATPPVETEFQWED